MKTTSSILVKKDLSTDLSYVFRDKSDRQLLKAYLLYLAIRSPALARTITRTALYAIKFRLPVIPLIRHSVFELFCGGETIKGCSKTIRALQKMKVGAILDYSAEGKEQDKDFDKTMEEVIKVIRYARGNKNIPYTSIKLTGIGKADILEKISNQASLTMAEEEDYRKFLDRFRRICRTAFECDVLLNVDAEESWIQKAIDELTFQMMRKYNGNKAIISFTLQMYRKDRLTFLADLLNYASREDLKAGIKLVRGAYWEKERNRALSSGYAAPVYETKEATDSAFNEAISNCLDHLDQVFLCAATHNEESTLFLMQQMRDRGISPNHPNICFSQLYGMSDHISFNLARSGYHVSKYLPYGPVRNVIPYLIRRAEENTSIRGQMGREFRMIAKERQRRKAIVHSFSQEH